MLKKRKPEKNRKNPMKTYVKKKSISSNHPPGGIKIPKKFTKIHPETPQTNIKNNTKNVKTISF